MTRNDDHETARPKGRPRSPATGEAITEATLDLIAETQSIETVSIEAIAARAGVGKATIYRRWPNKEALIVDAISALKGTIPPLKGESVREDLLDIANALSRTRDTREGQIYPCLMLEMKRNPELVERQNQALTARRQIVLDVLERGIRTGELRADIDPHLINAMLTSPILMISMYRAFRDVEPERLGERVVDVLLAGITGE